MLSNNFSCGAFLRKCASSVFSARALRENVKRRRLSSRWIRLVAYGVFDHCEALLATLRIFVFYNRGKLRRRAHMRTTTIGLKPGEPVHIKGSDIQRPFDGTYIGETGRCAEIKSSYNGGVYLVRIERIRRITKRAERRARGAK
jgi:hypothetical protein